jgi:hypothetical protein
MKKKNSQVFKKVFEQQFIELDTERDKYLRIYLALCYCKGYFNSDDSEISKVLNAIIEINNNKI